MIGVLCLWNWVFLGRVLTSWLKRNYCSRQRYRCGRKHVWTCYWIAQPRIWFHNRRIPRNHNNAVWTCAQASSLSWWIRLWMTSSFSVFLKVLVVWISSSTVLLPLPFYTIHFLCASSYTVIQQSILTPWSYFVLLLLYLLLFPHRTS